MSQLRLLAVEPQTTGTCPSCKTEQPTFLYDARAPAPWWYMVEHPVMVDGVAGGWCPGGGFPAVEQEKPARG